MELRTRKVKIKVRKKKKKKKNKNNESEVALHMLSYGSADHNLQSIGGTQSNSIQFNPIQSNESINRRKWRMDKNSYAINVRKEKVKR